jgi:uncharacterized protein Smg (DUF494 family)
MQCETELNLVSHTMHFPKHEATLDMIKTLLLIALLGFAVTVDVLTMAEAVAQPEGGERRDDRS